MSGGATAMYVMAAVTAAAAANSAYQSNQQAKDQKHTADVARKQAADNAKAQEEATNRADVKSPDTSSILSAAQQAGKSGVSSTMLTGSGGVDASSLSLGKSTLLGG